MSGFLSHLAARGIGQAGSVHSAARLPYASPLGLAEAASEALAPSPALQSLPHGAPPQELAPGPAPARPDGVGAGAASRTPMPASALLRPASILAPTPEIAPSRDDPDAREAAHTIDGGRALRAPADSPTGAIPLPIVPGAARRAEAAPTSDEGPLPLRRIQPLLPPQQGPNGTALLKGAARAQGAAGRMPVEETTEVHVSIGRIEVTAVHEAPPPKRAPARSQRALSLEEYLARRKAGRS
jgi:hypothetical protein